MVAPLSRSPFPDSSSGAEEADDAEEADEVEEAEESAETGAGGVEGAAGGAAGAPHCDWNPPTGLFGTAVGDEASSVG